MKALILTAVIVLSSYNSYAGTWAIASNEANGIIALTDERCPNNKTGNLMYTTNKSGKSIFGCWVYFKNDDVVHVNYFDDNTNYVYPLKGFKFTPYADKKYNAKDL